MQPYIYRSCFIMQCMWYKTTSKRKNEGKQIQGYHHFVAPIYMDNRAYRVMITAREKQNSDALYVVKTEVIKTKEGAQLLGQKPS
ncbi:MAG: hypothetical protein ACLRYB_18110 [Segatella copri]